jgi:hypothetical protein
MLAGKEIVSTLQFLAAGGRERSRRRSCPSCCGGDGSKKFAPKTAIPLFDVRERVMPLLTLFVSIVLLRMERK